jgi:hypothetical protein
MQTCTVKNQAQGKEHVGLLATWKAETTKLWKVCLILKIEVATKQNKDMKQTDKEH